MRIAVLGAGGFLGSHLVPALLAQGDCEVDAVDVTFDKLATVDPRLRRFATRIGARGVLDDVVGRCDLVLSLTALCNPALYSTRPIEVIDSNYTDLVPLVEHCAKRGKRLVHFSTCEVYGRSALDASARPMPKMNEEETAFFLGPLHRERWTYACAKQLLERVIWAYGQHEQLDFTIVRPFNVIGARMDFVPGVDGQGVPRVLASFMSALLRGGELLLVDGGRQKRSFISTGDFVEAIVRIVQRPEATRRQVINVGNPENNVTIRELARALGRAFEERVPGACRTRVREVTSEELYGPGYDDSLERLPDITKARRLLDWQPRTTLREMLAPIVDDYVLRYRSILTAPREAGVLLASGTGE
jgi:UDP-apiose/xylose synthase